MRYGIELVIFELIFRANVDIRTLILSAVAVSWSGEDYMASNVSINQTLQMTMESYQLYTFPHAPRHIPPSSPHDSE
jgi:hypothetical protein